MSNQARISAAIEKLERLKALDDVGPWCIDFGCTIVGNNGVVADLMEEPTADLIVTLHRTIEPQLELLHLALKYGELDAGSGSRFIAGAVKLADAILAED